MNSRNISLIVVLLLAPIALWFWMQYCGTKMLDTDYSTVGPDIMFQRVIGFAPPKGISVTKCAGHHGLGTGLVWMKFTGNDKAFQKLTDNMAPIPKGFTYTIPSGQFGAQKTFNQDAQDADWTDVADLGKPEVYLFRNNTGDEHWNGNVVLSRSTHTGYLSGTLVSGNGAEAPTGYGSRTSGAPKPSASPPPSTSPDTSGGPPAGYAR